MNAPAWGVRVPGSELKSEGGGRGSIRRPSTENTEGKMKSTLATILIGLALLGGIAFGGYTLYERHISTEARAAVLAALGDNVNDADVAVYLRTAKLAIRTKRDAYIVGLLDKTVEQAEKASRDQQEWTNSIFDSSTVDPLLETEKIDCQQLYGVHSSECRADAENAQSAIKEHKDEVNMHRTSADAEEKEAKRLMEILRTEMGLQQLQTGGKQ